jgi:Tfp pilus assembly protein PilV
MRAHAQRDIRRGARAESGFTILETVIALCIILVVGIGATGLFLFAANFNSGAGDRARALAVAQETMEELRAKPYGDAALAAGTTTTQVTRGSQAAGKSDYRTFTVRKVVENDTTTNPAGRRKKITVTVTPDAVGGRFNPGGVTVLMVRASDVVGSN